MSSKDKSKEKMDARKTAEGLIAPLVGIAYDDFNSTQRADYFKALGMLVHVLDKNGVVVEVNPE